MPQRASAQFPRMFASFVGTTQIEQLLRNRLSTCSNSSSAELVFDPDLREVYCDLGDGERERTDRSHGVRARGALGERLR